MAGNRVWGLLTPVGSQPAPSSTGRARPRRSRPAWRPSTASPTRSRSRPRPTGIDYVTSKGTTLVRRTNAGVVTSKPTHLTVNLTLSGPGAVQAQVVSGSTVFVKFAAGQGLDAVTYTYDATTLTGRHGPNTFSADAALGVTTLGVLVARRRRRAALHQHAVPLPRPVRRPRCHRPHAQPPVRLQQRSTRPARRPGRDQGHGAEPAAHEMTRAGADLVTTTTRRLSMGTDDKIANKTESDDRQGQGRRRQRDRQRRTSRPKARPTRSRAT